MIALRDLRVLRQVGCSLSGAGRAVGGCGRVLGHAGRVLGRAGRVLGVAAGLTLLAAGADACHGPLLPAQLANCYEGLPLAETALNAPKASYVFHGVK
ncbi:MAG TPA: hypothetical protein VED59_01435, partial [Acidimicrobiales bacterium]|nr:hypothetical protein [Acidimicrobiales bacterium]